MRSLTIVGKSTYDFVPKENNPLGKRYKGITYTAYMKDGTIMSFKSHNPAHEIHQVDEYIEDMSTDIDINVSEWEGKIKYREVDPNAEKSSESED